MSNRKKDVFEPFEGNKDEFDKITMLMEDMSKMLSVQICNQNSVCGDSEVTYIITAPVCTRRFICDK